MTLRIKKILMLSTALLLTASCVNAQYIRYTKAYGKKYVYLKDVAKYYGMSLVKGRKGCELRSRYSRIIFTYNKRSASLNGIKINFLHAPFVSKGEPMLSEVDFLSLLDPMLRKGALKRGKVKTIMIDPGHGGKDTGAIGTRYREKNIVLEISRKLRNLLKARGYRVLMTRTGDTFPSLHRRTNMCAKQKPDLFISIHCNAAGAKSARGIETYCMTPSGAPSTADKKPSYKTETGNDFDKNNIRLALETQKHLLKNTKANDRGVKHARFFVLKNASCPGILVEAGFLSNSYEERLLGSSAYQNKIAKGLADAITSYTNAVK
jgi:N-acetylmuramoyl-L-alanine amidase